LEPFLNGLRKYPQLIEETGFLLYLYLEKTYCCKQRQSSSVVEHGTAKWRVYGSSLTGYFINVLIYFYAVYAIYTSTRVRICPLGGRRLRVQFSIRIPIRFGVRFDGKGVLQSIFLFFLSEMCWHTILMGSQKNNRIPILFAYKSCTKSYGDSYADSDTCRRTLKGEKIGLQRPASIISDICAFQIIFGHKRQKEPIHDIRLLMAD
jgi:hypothetical protein